MAIIENFATVRYTSNGVENTTVSNLAEISLTSSVTLSKTILQDAYGDGSELTYILTLQNTSGSPLTNLRISDDLGSFPFGTAELTPLTYGNDAILLINGQNDASLSVDTTTAGELVFGIPSLPAGATANIVYTARINEFAPLDTGSTVVNTASLSADQECAEATATATIGATTAANVTVFKQMCPNPVVCGDTVTYTIRIYNYGNTVAENVRLTDSFDPAPTNLIVTRNGVTVPATDFTYEGGVLTVPAETAAGDTVPAATFTRDPVSGVVSVTPGVVEYVITGRI